MHAHPRVSVEHQHRPNTGSRSKGSGNDNRDEPGDHLDRLTMAATTLYSAEVDGGSCARVALAAQFLPMPV